MSFRNFSLRCLTKGHPFSTTNATTVTMVKKILHFNSVGMVPEAMLLLRENKNEILAQPSLFPFILRSFEASTELRKLFRSSDFSASTAYRLMSDVCAAARFEAVNEAYNQFLQVASKDNPAQPELLPTVMHVYTTCGYAPTKAIPQIYLKFLQADSTEIPLPIYPPTSPENSLLQLPVTAEKAVKPEILLATWIVVCRSLLLLRQQARLLNFVTKVWAQMRQLPASTLTASCQLQLVEILLDLYFEAGLYSLADDCFWAVAQQNGFVVTPYMVDALIRSYRASPSPFPPAHVAKLYTLMYEAGILPSEVAPLTWSFVDAAASKTLLQSPHLQRIAASEVIHDDDEVPAALKNSYLTHQVKLAKLVQDFGGVIQLEHFKDLLTEELEEKIRTGRYPAPKASSKNIP